MQLIPAKTHLDYQAVYVITPSRELSADTADENGFQIPAAGKGSKATLLLNMHRNMAKKQHDKHMNNTARYGTQEPGALSTSQPERAVPLTA